MSKLQTQFKQSGDVFSSIPPFPSHSITNTSQSTTKISPIVLLVIVILAIIIFVSGILHLLLRFLMKRPSFYSSVSHSNRYPDQNHTSNALQRQLQQLFRLHDSGLDQALVDALPVFNYKDIMGLKEPFECAVCLCEFSDQDNLRLLPICSHAFHITCIDTWLLTNSTCPLCRASLLNSAMENQQQLSFRSSIDGDHSNEATTMEENSNERRVFFVRLGKFRGSSNGEEIKEGDNGGGSSSSSSNKLDARRCYSMGSCQYVVDDLNLQVALSSENGQNGGIKIEKMVDMDVEAKKISGKNRGDSFSVSKIWLWSKKGKFQGCSQANNVYGVQGSLSVV